MNPTLRRWAQQRRLVGVIYLGATAVAIAAAVLLWATGGGWLIGFAILAAALLLILAGYAFIDGHRYAKQARRHHA